VLPFNQLESHQQTCQFRRVTCEHCNTETSVSQQEVMAFSLPYYGMNQGSLACADPVNKVYP